MAILSNINDKFAVDSSGGIQFSGQTGTAGYVLKSNGNAAPTWVDGSTVIGGPYLPLSGGTLTGATATASGISFTVGGVLTGTSATFTGNVILSSALPLLYLTNTTASTGKNWRLSSATNGKFFIAQEGVVDALTLDHTSGNATFTGDITLGDDLNFTTNGFADISNTGTGAMRFKPSSQTLALTLTGANATFAGNVGIGSAPVGNPATKFLAVGTAGSVAGGIQLWATNAQTHYIQFGDAASGGNYYRGAIGYAHASDTLLLLQSGSTALSFTGSQEATFAGNVGIGGAPSVELQVKASSGYAETRLVGASGSGGTLEFYDDTTKLADIYADPTKNLYFRTNGGTTALTLEADGDGIFRGSVTCDEALQISSTTAQYAYQNFGASAGYGWQIGKAPATGGVVDDQGFYLYNLNTGYQGVNLAVLKSGNVGIGTTEPSTKLTISGVQELLQLTRGGASDTKWFFSADSTRLFIAENTSATANIKLTINENGNVGIGTSTPSKRLHVEGSNHIVTFENTSTVANAYSQMMLQAGSAQNYIWTQNQNSTSYGGANSLNIYTQQAGAIAFFTSAYERMRIDSTGRTIIQSGTLTTPAYTPAQGYPLHVQGIANQCLISIGKSGQTTGSQGIIIGLDTTTSYLWNRDNINITFGTNDTTKMVILADGNVGIGTTAPSGKLMISDANNRTFSDAQFKIEGAGYTAAHYLDATAYFIVENSASRDIRIAASSNGVKLTPGATTWVSNSDISLKENLKPLDNVLDKIKDYRCVEYNLKNAPEDKKIGFIAQDWKNDFPAIIDEDKDGLLGMKYTETIPVLLKAIQELEARLKILENK